MHAKPDELVISMDLSGSDQQRAEYGSDSRTKQQQQKESICMVCGGLASGYHYDVLSCEGCKGFFRRRVHKNMSTKCRHDGNCEINVASRKKCPGCRLKKCLTVGMKQSCLLTEFQCNARGSRRMKRQVSENTEPSVKEQRLDADTVFYAGDNHTSSSSPVATRNTHSNMSSRGSSCSSDTLDDGYLLGGDVLQACLLQDTKSLIDSLLKIQEKYKLIPQELLSRYTTDHAPLDLCTKTVTHEGRQQKLSSQHAQTTILTADLIIRSAKETYPFSQFGIDDQTMMIRGSMAGLSLLRLADTYNSSTDSVTMADTEVHTTDSLRYIGGDDLPDCVFQLSRNLSELCTDNIEFSLLSAIYLYSERLNIKNQSLLHQAQELYSSTLQQYCDYKEGPQSGCKRFAKLIMKIVNLNELGQIHNSVRFPVKLDLDLSNTPEFLQNLFQISVAETHTLIT